MKIKVFTSTRADFGIIKNLFVVLEKNFNTELIVTGTHFSQQHGFTVDEINKNKIKVSKKIKWQSFSDNILNIGGNFSRTLTETIKILKKKTDLVIILGDRYEMLAIAIASHLSKIPIAHLYGGEVTSGAIDDAFRHSISKLSQIHFVANDNYRKRVIQLGENPQRVFNVGGLAIENIKKQNLFTKEELEKALKIKFLKRNIIVNFHPTTLDKKKSIIEIKEINSSLKKLRDILIIYTMPGADLESSKIYKEIKSFTKKNKNAYFYSSLGQKNYFSLLNQVDFMLGNSSSGILEMPYFKKITINLGNRQNGRMKAKSIIDIDVDKKIISKTINQFYNKKFINLNKTISQPYGSGGTIKKIIKILSKVNTNKILYKKFYDIKL